MPKNKPYPNEDYRAFLKRILNQAQTRTAAPAAKAKAKPLKKKRRRLFSRRKKKKKPYATTRTKSISRQARMSMTKEDLAKFRDKKKRR